MFLAGRWYRLTLDPKLVPQNDPIGRLPVTLLASTCFEPLFGIVDQRTDKRIDFIGGGRGLEGLENGWLRAKWPQPSRFIRRR